MPDRETAGDTARARAEAIVKLAEPMLLSALAQILVRPGSAPTFRIESDDGSFVVTVTRSVGAR